MPDAAAPAELRVPCVLMRGGTSRGLVFLREDLPDDPGLRDLLFLAAIGSPDPRQLDGVGAGDSHTSKVAIVNRSAAPDVDLDYLFGEVAITEPRVDYAGNSGNLIAALGLYAVQAGWVSPRDLPPVERTPEAPQAAMVRVRNVNTDKISVLRVPCAQGRVATEGHFRVDGVPGEGPRIDMVFPHPEGALTGKLLPTGQARQLLDVPGVGPLEVTLLDAANPVVLVAGKDLGVPPDATPAELNADEGFRTRVQALRGQASVAMGLVTRAEEAWAHSPMVPFPVLLFPAAGPGGGGVDFAVKVVSLGLVHKSVNVTVSVALTAAALTPGTLAHALRVAHGGRAALQDTVRFAHPAGQMETWGALSADATQVEEVRLGRTARRILEGQVLVDAAKLRWLRAQRAQWQAEQESPGA